VASLRGDRLKKLPPRRRAVAEAGHQASPTAVAAEAMRTGVLPGRPRRRGEILRESDTMLLGDPDDRILANAYVGEETPGGSTPTPDQNGVDEIGRAYGLQEEDNGVLRSAAEVLTRRDRRRVELQPPGRPRV
jgi:hypothetical protein